MSNVTQSHVLRGKPNNSNSTETRRWLLLDLCCGSNRRKPFQRKALISNPQTQARLQLWR